MIYLPNTQVWTNLAYVHSSITLCLTWLPSGRSLILLLVLLRILLATLGPPGHPRTLMDPRHPRSVNMSKSPSCGLPKLGPPSKGLSSGNQTWLAGKSSVNGSLNRKITDKCSIFHCHVWLPAGNVFFSGESYWNAWFSGTRISGNLHVLMLV